MRDTYIDEGTGQIIYPDEIDPGVPWIPPDASFGENPSGVINNQNPAANPSQPFVQAGDTGGYINGIGVTAGQGQSDTLAQQQSALSAAIAAGVPAGWAADWLARNPGDQGRILAAWNSGQTGSGPDAQNGVPATPAVPTAPKAGVGSSRRPLDPPPDLTLPEYHAPTWDPYPDYVAPIFQAPEPWSYAEFTKPTLEEAKTEPGYQFAMEQGMKALEASAAAKGTLNTGGTLKDLIGYGQAMGEQNYNNVFTRSKDVWSSNKDLSKSIWDTDFGARKDKFTYDTNAALDNYGKGYQAFTDANRAAVDRAEKEYAPKREQAILSYQNALAVWQRLMESADILEQDNA